MIPHDTVLDTPCLCLRKPVEGDIAYVFSASRHPGFCDGMTWNPPEKAEDLLENFRQSQRAWDAGTDYTFTIETKESGAMAGRVSIRKPHDVWTIGFWTHPEFQGRGYMTEAAARILQFGFEQLGAEEIQASHTLWNKASRRVLEKIGMRYLAHLTQGFEKNGAWIAEEMLGITRAEWGRLGAA